MDIPELLFKQLSIWYYLGALLVRFLSSAHLAICWMRHFGS